MKPTNQQPLDACHLNKNSIIKWKKAYYNHVFDWNTPTIEKHEHCMPIIVESSPSIDKRYCFEKKTRLSRNHIIIQENPIKDYFRSSLCSCLICFWMLAGIVCLIQSIKIRRLLKKNNPPSKEEARQLSNRLYTNLVLTYVIGGIIIGVLILTVLVTFVVGLKGYFSRSL